MKTSINIVGAATVVAGAMLTQAAPIDVQHVQASSLNAAAVADDSLHQRGEEQLIARMDLSGAVEGGFKALSFDHDLPEASMPIVLNASGRPSSPRVVSTSRNPMYAPKPETTDISVVAKTYNDAKDKYEGLVRQLDSVMIARQKAIRKKDQPTKPAEIYESQQTPDEIERLSAEEKQLRVEMQFQDRQVSSTKIAYDKAAHVWWEE